MVEQCWTNLFRQALPRTFRQSKSLVATQYFNTLTLRQVTLSFNNPKFDRGMKLGVYFTPKPHHCFKPN